jgi:hypothetical protein
VVSVPSKSNKHKNFEKKKYFLLAYGRLQTKRAGYGAGSISQRYGTRIRIRTKCHGSGTVLSETGVYVRINKISVPLTFRKKDLGIYNLEEKIR